MSDADPPEPPRSRRIRSYVLRAGRVTVAQKRALTELWPRFGLDAPADANLIDLTAVFGRSAPRMIEIGFGAGEALLDFALRHPDTDCLGIEVHPPGVGQLLLGVDTAQITNVRVTRHDAVEVLQDWLKPASVSAVHLFFPDPWPKKRHHKRRIVQPAFADLVARVLEPGGVFRLATDWEPYAHQMREVLDEHASLENLAGPSGFVPRPEDRPLTRFERRGQRLGHAVWDLAYAKKATGAGEPGSA